MQITQRKSLKQLTKEQLRYDDNFSSREIIERPVFLVVVKVVKTKKAICRLISDCELSFSLFAWLFFNEEFT